jgi:hypothetical protein
MSAARRNGVVFTGESRPAPVGLFKTSLRDWQAQWRAQKAAQAQETRESAKPFQRLERA